MFKRENPHTLRANPPLFKRVKTALQLKQKGLAGFKPHHWNRSGLWALQGVQRRKSAVCDRSFVACQRRSSIQSLFPCNVCFASFVDLLFLSFRSRVAFWILAWFTPVQPCVLIRVAKWARTSKRSKLTGELQTGLVSSPSKMGDAELYTKRARVTRVCVFCFLNVFEDVGSWQARVQCS